MLDWLRKRRTVRKRSTYLDHKELARSLIHARLEALARQHDFSYKRVAIRDTKRSWGSCSSNGNLNFSYKLLFLPPCLRDYIIIHELCHLRELNHSQAFWDQVEQILPAYRELKHDLRRLERTRGTAIRTLRAIRSEHACAYCLAESVKMGPES